MKLENKGVFSVVGAAILWGMQGVLSKSVFATTMSPFSLATYKVGFAFLGLMLGILIFRPSYFKIKLKHLPLLIAYGITGVGLFNLFLLLSVKLNTVSTAITLIYTAPAFVSIFSALFLGEHFSTAKLFALISTLSGCFLVVKGYAIDWSALDWSGLGAGLAAGFTYSLYSVLGKKCVHFYSHWTVMLYGLGCGTALLAIIAPPGDFGLYPGIIWLNILFLALGTTLLANILYVLGLTLLEASKASMIATLEPVVAVLLAMLILKETLVWPQVVGFLMVMFAVFLLTLKKPDKSLLSAKKNKTEGV
ncbi:DMT family transporter [Metallumcola ferriviriculae]|uniref:DMT family transporter n=1 Tax=Metallumcola ferriviriculae TaxID=3039180 RepID=A0AAU0UJQ3_9FIRM|nr:DMT family transporter [Desulfitibacteraceae bacterium MK1]